MSFKIAANKVYLTVGDTARFSISLIDLPENLQNYTLSDKDKVYFIVTDSPKIVNLSELEDTSSCIFYKTGINILISPEDTMNLDTGEYYYQVRVILSESGDLNTIIEPTEFYLTPIKGW